MKNSKYILITPVKNEEGTIDQVIDSVIAQDIIPTLWIIVNDGSTDNSQKIIEEKIKNKKWIILINKEINKVYNWLGYSKVIIEGINYCKMNDLFKKLSISYIGILDSDITIPKDYFKDLIFILEKDPLIGAIAGGVYVK
jgi:glycosyltransferase involved in cell wall biosynthesis